MKPTILLTWDVEEYDAPADFGAPALFDGGLDRGLEIWRQWLEVSAGWPAPGTAFITAKLAQASPDLLRKTMGRGHEIASHAWSHKKGDDLKLKASRQSISEIAGTDVVGFRSPRLCPVPLPEVAAAGYRYDASSNPALVPGRYCRWGQKRLPHRVGNLWEVPASVLPLVRFPLFWASFHILPWPLYLAACRLVLATEGLLTLYFHPWELADLAEPQFPLWLRRRSGIERIARMERLVRWLGKTGNFRTISDYLDGTRVTRP